MKTETTNQHSTDNDGTALSVIMINLLKGVLYQEADASRWSQLLNLQAQVRDYAAVLGLELILDKAEGYAYLRSRPTDGDDNMAADKSQDIPRLIARRPLSFPVSLLLALLRKKLAEFDAGGGDTRLVLTENEIIELMRVFLPESSNEAKLVDQIERYINKIIELGFLRRLKTNGSKQPSQYEVCRIIKSFVDAQWLSELDQKLDEYKQHLTGGEQNEHE